MITGVIKAFAHAVQTISPITFVGSGITPATGVGGTFNWAFTNLLNEAGGVPTLQQNDLVIVNYAMGGQVDRPFTPPTGYIEDHEIYVDGTSADTNHCVWYKKMGAVVDTQITGIPNKGVSTESSSASVMVFRGVDPSTPLDVASVLASGTATSVNDPAEITPVTSGAMVVICAAGAGNVTPTTAYSNPGDLEADPNNFKGRTVIDTYRSLHAIGFQGTLPLGIGGPFNPLPFGGGDAAAGNSWSTVTLALRPA